MLKITPYLGILVIVVSIGGLWYPKLGYFLVIIFATILMISPFKGRWFCGNLCPRGSFNDFWLGKITLGKRIPDFLRSLWIRVPVFIALMGFMTYRVANTGGITDKIGMVFVTMCIATTALAIIFGILISPRAWCSFCPMGTLQRWFGGRRHQLKMEAARCTKCMACSTACPMHLKVHEITHHQDCIKCGRCLGACIRKALHW